MSEEIIEPTETLVVKTASPESKPKKKAKSNRKKTPTPLQQKITYDFAACGRCSYFWAGYRVVVGQEGIDTAVDGMKSGWMDLAWNQETRTLIHKSFGVRLDAEFYHYEGCCQECCRQFYFDQKHGRGCSG